MNKLGRVLVPFYRGAVVFVFLKWLLNKKPLFSSPFIEERLYLLYNKVKCKKTFKSSRPLLSRSGCIWSSQWKKQPMQNFRSRPLLSRSGCIYSNKGYVEGFIGSRPLLSRSGCISRKWFKLFSNRVQFSSPFIEERLYFKIFSDLAISCPSSRPLLSRSGCI